MTRVPYLIPLQDYPTNVDIHPSKYNKLLLQKAINKAKTVVYKSSPQQSLTSSSTYSRRRTQNWQHQQDGVPVVTLIAVIHRPSIRERIHVDEEN